MKARRRRGPRPFAALLAVGVLGSWAIYSTHVFQDALGPPAIDNGPATDDGVSTPSTVVATTAPTGHPLLPDTVYVRPAYRVANFVGMNRRVGDEGGVPFEKETLITSEVDYVTPVASVVVDSHGGDLSLTALQFILANEYIYVAGEPAGEPWTRVPHEAWIDELANIEFLMMYDEVVTPEVSAAATDVIVTGEVLRGIPVTTYQFDVPWILLSEFTVPTISSNPIVQRKALDSMPEGQRYAHVTLSVDIDGLIRVADYQLDEQAWIDAAAAAPEDLVGDVHTRLEIISTSNEPSTVVPPTLFVDGPTG